MFLHKAVAIMQQIMKGKKMFTAMVLACAIGSVDATTCIEAIDEKGPYETRKECYVRVQEMVEVLMATMPVPMQYSFKCDEGKGQIT